MGSERKAFKAMSAGEKLEHIWEYYKLVLFGIIVALILIIYVVSKLLSPDPESILNVTLVNANSMMVEEGEDVFFRYLVEHDYDTRRETIAVNDALHVNRNEVSESSSVGIQALAAMTLVGEIDLLAGDEGVFEILAVGNGMMEMDSILPEELMEKYRGSLYTVKVEETGEEHTCGIRLPAGNPLEQDGYYFGPDTLVGIPYTAVHQDMAKEMLLYLLGE